MFLQNRLALGGSTVHRKVGKAFLAAVSRKAT